MVENPRLLAGVEGSPAAGFAGGKYNMIKLDRNTVLYRAGQAGGGRNAFGQWFTQEPIVPEAQGRLDLAIKPYWTDTEGVITGVSPLKSTYALKIPKGTVVYQGPVAYQGGSYLGGQNIMQICVPKPWAIPGVDVLGETPLVGQ